MEIIRQRALAGAAALAALLLLPADARGEAGATVRPPSAAQIKAASSLLSRGLVVQIEDAPGGGMQQVTLIGRVDAPQKVAYDLLSDPDALHPMQPPMREIEVRARKGNAVTYRWRYDGTLVDIHGSTSMALAPPSAVMWIFGEGFGPGQLLWRLQPDGEQTIASLTLAVDVTKSSHTILRWLAKSNPHQKESWNLGYGIVSLRGLQAVAAERAGRKGFPVPSGESGSGPLRPLTEANVKALLPLLRQGAAGIIEQDGRGRVLQTVFAQKVGAPPRKLLDGLSSPSTWGSPVKGVEFRTREGEGSGAPFEFRFAFPAFTISTDMLLRTRPDGVDIEAPAGALKGSLLSFGVLPDGSTAILTGAARFRPRQANFILRRMIDDDPYFGHALNASALAVWMRAMRARAEGR
jgi:hypothetical protein